MKDFIRQYGVAEASSIAPSWARWLLAHAAHQCGRRIGDALVKVDVEGAGEKVWDGAAGMSKAIRCLVMEMLAPETKAGLSRQDHWRNRS